MPIQEIANRLKSINVDSIVKQILRNPLVQAQIIDFNTHEQLFLKGIDSEGRTLKSIGGSRFTPSGYAPFTIRIKQAEGQRTQNITLNDTGEFYNSFTVTVGGDSFTIDANPNKNGDNLFDDWGEDIVGLTDENLQKLIDDIEIQLVEIVMAEIVG